MGKRGPQREGIRGGDGVILVEDDATEAESLELSPVNPADIGDGDVGKGKVGVLGGDAGEEGDARRVKALAEGAAPRRLAHGGGDLRLLLRWATGAEEPMC